MEVTKTLARYIVQSQREDIPAGVRHEAARALLNWCGCAIGGLAPRNRQQHAGGGAAVRREAAGADTRPQRTH